MHIQQYALHGLSRSLNVFKYYLFKSVSICMASWCPFCLHTEAKITDIILIAEETIFFGLSMKALAVLHELHVCWFMGFFFFRVQKKTTSMSLTIRSASPKTPEALPLRSTLVQALSQPPQRVSPCNTQIHRSSHTLSEIWRQLLSDITIFFSTVF